MFQTDPILFLQRFEGLFPNHFFGAINQLGYSEFTIPFVIVLLFGIHVRRGILLAQVLLWNSLFTDVLKAAFALPRPSEVDSAVRLLPGGQPNPSPFEGADAPAWYRPLPADVVEHYRTLDGYSFGMPSGHVSATVTLWGGIAILFQRRPLIVLAVVMTVLMGLTRMYFGRHFIADVLGGVAVGAVALAGLAVVRRTLPRRTPGLATAMKISLLIVPPLCLLFLGPEPETVARLLGVNLASLLLQAQGLPADDAVLWRRAARVGVGFLVYFAAAFATGAALETAFGETRLVEALAAFIPATLGLWGGVRLNEKLGLFTRPPTIADRAVAATVKAATPRKTAVPAEK